MEALGLAALIIGVSVAFAAAGVLLGRRLIQKHVATHHNDVMISLFASAKVVYAVLLAFVVVVVWEAYGSADRNAAQEAATLVPLYRLTFGMEEKHGAHLRTVIRDYARAVIEDEWPTLGDRKPGSQKARRIMGEMDRHFATLDPGTKVANAQVDAEFLSIKSTIMAHRNERLLESFHHIPWVMWLGAIGGGVITMLMSFLIYMERGWPHVLMASLDGALTGLLLFIMLVLSRPFSGPLAIGPEDFVAAIAIFDEADKGY